IGPSMRSRPGDCWSSTTCVTRRSSWCRIRPPGPSRSDAPCWPTPGCSRSSSTGRAASCWPAVSDLEVALRLADAADAIARHFVGTPPASQQKPDGSPVTDVDVAVERALLAIVQRDLPGDSFLGEEVGARDSGPDSGDRRWIVDGIDGTSAFVVGRAEWATLI